MNFLYGSKIQYAPVSGVFFFYDEGLFPTLYVKSDITVYVSLAVT
jgi:hypothetical protein